MPFEFLFRLSNTSKSSGRGCFNKDNLYLYLKMYLLKNLEFNKNFTNRSFMHNLENYFSLGIVRS